MKVMDRKATSIKQVMRTVFSRNGVPKMIVTECARILRESMFMDKMYWVHSMQDITVPFTI